jgi:hypothetical protein
MVPGHSRIREFNFSFVGLAAILEKVEATSDCFNGLDVMRQQEVV